MPTVHATHTSPTAHAPAKAPLLSICGTWRRASSSFRACVGAPLLSFGLLAARALSPRPVAYRANLPIKASTPCFCRRDAVRRLLLPAPCTAFAAKSRPTVAGHECRRARRSARSPARATAAVVRARGASPRAAEHHRSNVARFAAPSLSTVANARELPAAPHGESHGRKLCQRSVAPMAAVGAGRSLRRLFPPTAIARPPRFQGRPTGGRNALTPCAVAW
ncbi:hypothetical protein ERJ75_001706000 [Trypanosoma vivax]|nr:hypothetical protein ERJ75_001706000 [Trypanosoma vivax]